MPTFVPLSGGNVRVRLDESEAAVLRRLLDEMRQVLLVAEDQPDDPIRTRLFPNAYDDPDDERAYRELVDSDLLHAKLTAIELVERAIGKHPEIDGEIEGREVDAWLTLLTDMRLAVGTRLHVDEEKMSAEFGAGDPDAPALAVLHWMGWVQELLLEAIEKGAADAEPGSR